MKHPAYLAEDVAQKHISKVALMLEQQSACLRASRRYRVIVLLLAIYACTASIVRGEATSALAGFHHTAWRVSDGAPPDIWAMAQGPRGYLWLGTGSGLYRFDGLSFERYVAANGERLKSTNVTSLKFTASGDLWIGYYEGGVSVLHEGRLKHYGVHDGVPPGMVSALETDVSGSGVWIAARGGLAHFDGQQWQVTDENQWGYPTRRADWVLRDAKGTLWAATGDAVVYLDASTQRFRRFEKDQVGLNAVLANAPDGRVWVSDETKGTRPLESGGEAPVLRERFAKRLLFDREGNVWGTDAIRGGVFRANVATASTTNPQVFASAQGLSADIAVPIIQDEEGNIWVGTNLGLDRFRASNFFPASDAPSVPDATPLLVANERGAVWTIEGAALSRIVGTRLAPVLTLPRKAWSAYCDPNGVVWISDLDGLRRVEQGRITHIPWPHEEWKDAVVAYGSDAEGALWLSVFNHGVFRYADGAWKAQAIDPDEANAAASAIATAADGSMWFGVSRDRLVHRTASGSRVYGASDGLSVGGIATLHPDGAGVLVGGELGYATMQGDSFKSVTSLPASNAITQVSGIVRTRDGDLWLNASRGVVRVNQADAARSSAAVPDPAEYKLYDFNDGLPGVALQSQPVPTLATDLEGRVWVSTNRGIVWADPASMRVNHVPPLVNIKAAYSDRPMTDFLNVRVPGSAPNIRIEYSALNLSAPERVQFRYRLAGLEDRWVDAGSRREAAYSHLSPGYYRFEVLAANEDNVWSPQAASLDIEVVPRFVETTAFRVGAAIGVAGLALAAYLVRMRLLASAFRTRLRERLEERERIARELHDTLLQSIQGLILRFQAIANRIPVSDPNRAGIESALDRADQVMAAGRERVRDLRTSEATVGDLDEAFARIARDLSFDHAVQFKISAGGAQRELACETREEVYGIGREALLNAFRHADASHIDLILDYGIDAFGLSVRDDGKGFDPRMAKTFERSAHFGLRGMHERARRISGRLDIETGNGRGTTISLTVPARSAYESPGWRSFRWMRRIFDEESV